MQLFLSWRTGPERNALAIAGLITLLAGIMLVDSVLFPLPGIEHDMFNKVAGCVTAGLFGCAVLALTALLTGWTLVGRFAIVAYGSGLVTAMSAILGSDTGIDVIGATCLLMGPGVIFSRHEWRSMVFACLISLTAIGIMTWRLHGGAAPLLTIESAYMAEIRTGATIVAVCVGGLIIYLYWAAETARAQATREQARSDELLLNILPRPVADRLKRGEREIADGLSDVTVLFADIAGFTRFAATHPPTEVVHLLNRIFSRFDALCIQHGVEKLKTIGDGYMAVAGAPLPFADHAVAAARLALDMQNAMASIRLDYPELSLRVGLNSGPAIAGVMGTHKFAYDVWGDSVNLASRLESNAPLNGIAISASVLAALHGHFQFKPLGELDLKGKGMVPAWELLAA
jgi:class 3 adenylate cyclase